MIILNFFFFNLTKGELFFSARLLLVLVMLFGLASKI